MDKTLPPQSEKNSEVAQPPRRVQSEELLWPGEELVIVHHGREYRLRLTQNDKRILTA